MPGSIVFSLKLLLLAGIQWLMPVILAIWEAEIRRMEI
jgi:hypothetical protein